MTGGPWHCGFPMRAGGGYQTGGDKSWLAWKCESCAHQEIVWGKIIYEPNTIDGVQRFVPLPRKTLTILMQKDASGHILCRGVSEDEDIFPNTLFTTTAVAMDHLHRHYSCRGFRCVFNLPKESG